MKDLRGKGGATNLVAKEVTKVGTSAKVRKVLERVLEEQPCSLRRLADEAEVPHSVLSAARSGTRNLTQDSADAVVAALRRWGKTCNRLANDLENATRKGGGQRGQETRKKKRARG